MSGIKNNRGMTLVNLITAVGVSGLVLLIIATLSMYVYVQFENTKAQLQAEASANRLEYLFKLYLTQAINISGVTGLTEVTGANFSVNDATATGRWFGVPNGAAVVWDQMGDLVGNWATLGVFVRETGMGTDSDLQPTAIWYRKPTAATSGVIFFDTGATPGNMVPDYGDPFVSGITRFEFQRQDIGVPAQLSSLRINFRLRYQRKRGNAGVNWCPTVDITNGVAGCATPGASYREIEKNFDVVLRNNFRSAVGVNGTPGEVRTLGRLYFFQITNPARWNL